ncbi:hypothetical protein LguiA_011242 [Lonicera macranthoides]
MSSNPASTVYVGNLDEKVSDRVLYDILVQAGRVVDLYIPRDKENDRPKGYAFAEYENEEIANYAVKLFSGLVTLYKRTLKFGISGQDKQAPNVPLASVPALNSTSKARPKPVPFNNTDFPLHTPRLPTPRRFSTNILNDAQVPVSPGVVHQPYGYRLLFDNNNDYDYSRPVFGTTLDSMTRTRSSRYDMSNPINYAPY